MKYFIFVLFLICSCESIKMDEQEYYIGYHTPMIERAVFFKDDQTQLCFAALGTTTSYVPCTPEVEKLAIHTSSRKQ